MQCSNSDLAQQIYWCVKTSVTKLFCPTPPPPSYTDKHTTLQALPVSFSGKWISSLGCAIGQDDLIAQIGLLILEGRTLQDVKSNMKDYKNWDDGLIHFRKVW